MKTLTNNEYYYFRNGSNDFIFQVISDPIEYSNWPKCFYQQWRIISGKNTTSNPDDNPNKFDCNSYLARNSKHLPNYVKVQDIKAELEELLK